MASSSTDENCWIYHERQQAALCGQHALNNLCQAAIFSADYLAEVAQQLDLQELAMYGPPNSAAYQARLREGSGNVDSTGNFSIQVLRSALINELGIELPNINDKSLPHHAQNKTKINAAAVVKDVTDYEGFICHKSAHWFAIRKIKDRFWNLNSFLPKPEVISHFRIAAEINALQAHDYAVFVAMPAEGEHLPPICLSDAQRSRGKMKYWWKESGLSGASTAGGGINYTSTDNFSYEDTTKVTVNDSANATQDPWLNAGSGKKLINKSEENETTSEFVNYDEVKVRDEVSGSGDGVVKIQLKLPHGKKVVRKFEGKDTVRYIYAVVASLCEGNATIKPEGKRLQLSAGFPPKILQDGDLAVEQAGLNAATITCRWI